MVHSVSSRLGPARGADGSALAGCGNPFAIKNRLSYQAAMRDVTNDPSVVEQLGWPVQQTGPISLTKFESNGGTREDAVFSTRIAGPAGSGHVSVQSACVLNECATQFQFRLISTEGATELQTSTRDISGVELRSLVVTEAGVAATIHVPKGVEFKVYPAGSANAYTLYDATTGASWPATAVDAPQVGAWSPGPFDFTVTFDADSRTAEAMHVIEGEAGFADTEQGISFYSVPLPWTR